MARNVGRLEAERAGGVGEVDGARREGFLEGFVQSAGFGGEEGARLGVAVEEEDAEGGGLIGGGGGEGRLGGHRAGAEGGGKRPAERES